jgi:hypothetical protein
MKHEKGREQSGLGGRRRTFFQQTASTSRIAYKDIRYAGLIVSIHPHIFNTDGSADLSAMRASSAFKLLSATKDALTKFSAAIMRLK